MKNTYVIGNDNNDLYFTGFVGDTPSWGIIANAVVYDTEAEAQEVCDKLAIGGIHPEVQPHH